MIHHPETGLFDPPGLNRFSVSVLSKTYCIQKPIFPVALVCKKTNFIGGGGGASERERERVSERYCIKKYNEVNIVWHILKFSFNAKS